MRCDNNSNEQNISNEVLKNENIKENALEKEDIGGQIDKVDRSIKNVNVYEQNNFEINCNNSSIDPITYSTGYIAEDFNVAWERYWYEYGESLVWDSWIRKYKDFINPEYISAYKNNEYSENIKLTSTVKSVEAKGDNFQNTVSNDVSLNEEFEKKLNFDDQWSRLWDSHCQEEYFYQYNQFLLNRFAFSNWKEETNHFENCQINDKSTAMNSLQDLCKKVIYNNAVIGKTITIKEDINETPENENRGSEITESSEDEQYNDDFQQMISLNLPVSFGNSRTNKTYNDTSSSTPNISQTNDSIKTAFELLSVKFDETKEMKTFTGHVNYKVKHIRRQNRKLKIFPFVSDQKITPKHIFFDDEGNTSEIKPSSSNNISYYEDGRCSIDEFSKEADNKDNEECITKKWDEGDTVVTKPSSSNNDSDCESKGYYIENNSLQNAEEQEKSTDIKINSKKQRNRKRKANLPLEIKNNLKLKKYWGRRFSLFSKFDLGVKLDEESWFSVTPERIAKHTAQRCRCDVIIDAFCGAGGNSIQFASTCKKVIAIDIDPNKIKLARNNAQVYGVADRIEFIVGDFFQLADKLKADVVFLSPPWGGPSYLNLPDYDLENFLQPKPVSELLQAVRNITENLALFLPKNSNTFPLLLLSGEGKSVEIEQNFLNDRLIAITAYYGKLIKSPVM